MLSELRKYIESEANLAEEFVEQYKKDDVIIMCGGGMR